MDDIYSRYLPDGGPWLNGLCHTAWRLIRGNGGRFSTVINMHATRTRLGHHTIPSCRRVGRLFNAIAVLVHFQPDYKCDTSIRELLGVRPGKAVVRHALASEAY